jgi:hypothetical protein
LEASLKQKCLHTPTNPHQLETQNQNTRIQKKVHEEPHCLYTLNYHVQTGKKRYNSNKAKSSKATKRVEIS